MQKIKSLLKGESSDSSEQSTSNSSGSDATYESESAGTADVQRSQPQSSFESTEQRVAPAVQHETVTGKHEDRVQQVVEKDRHHDHYHTTVQPLTDRQVEPTKHVEQQAQTQHREFDHDDGAKTEAALQAQAAQFKDTTTHGGVIATSTNLGNIESESTHHHLHETVQPVIQREIVQPSVTHTTVPIKEVHHEASHIHDQSVAAPMSVQEFSKLTNAEGSQK